jgi:hypothetical protein
MEANWNLVKSELRRHGVRAQPGRVTALTFQDEAGYKIFCQQGRGEVPVGVVWAPTDHFPHFPAVAQRFGPELAARSIVIGVAFSTDIYGGVKLAAFCLVDEEVDFVHAMASQVLDLVHTQGKVFPFQDYVMLIMFADEEELQQAQHEFETQVDYRLDTATVTFWKFDDPRHPPLVKGLIQRYQTDELLLVTVGFGPSEHELEIRMAGAFLFS